MSRSLEACTYLEASGILGFLRVKNSLFEQYVLELRVRGKVGNHWSEE